MTKDELDRLNIVKEVCSIADASLQEIYNFIKTGNTTGLSFGYTDTDVKPTPADGVYIVFKDGTYTEFSKAANELTEEDNAAVAGIGIKHGDRALVIALRDCADGNDITLTVAEDETEAESRYIDTFIDAVADWDGKGNTAHLRQIGLNPAIELEPGQWVPSVAEMYLIYTNRKAINAALRKVGGMEIPGKWYLTSTENSATIAWFLNLNDGILSWHAKASNKGGVRPVSAFIFNR